VVNYIIEYPIINLKPVNEVAKPKLCIIIKCTGSAFLQKNNNRVNIQISGSKRCAYRSLLIT